MLKERVTTAPVLMHFDHTKKAYIETDSSDYVTAGVLSQIGDDGELHPVAFYSRKMLPAECNYEIYDKELLAIIKSFEQWRPELEGTDLPVKVLTDHKGLDRFMTKQKLTRRQARWAEMLSEYNFEISYRDGKSNTKADSLTRQADSRPVGLDDERVKHQEQVLLDPTLFIAASDFDVPSCHDVIREATAHDEDAQRVTQAVLAGEDQVDMGDWAMKLPEAKMLNGFVTIKEKIWVPTSCTKDVILEVHSQRASGHPGTHKTIELIKETFCWRGLRTEVKQFLRNCHACRRAKAPRHKKNGLLQPLLIPQRRWAYIAIDFVTGLPESNGNNAILTVTDRLTKAHHFIACRAGEFGTSAEATAIMLVRHVWKHHGLCETIVSDRGTQFVSDMWKCFCKILGITRSLSTAYHPETDGQSENSNQYMEQYLRLYVAYDQSNWDELLPLAEFAANAVKSEATGLSPFHLNYGFEPTMSFHHQHGLTALNTQQRHEFQRAEDITSRMDSLLKQAKEFLKIQQKAMSVAANAHRRPIDFHEGDLVWLNSKNLRTDRPSRKLDHKMIGPFMIIAKHRTSCELRLPAGLEAHPTFPVELLQKDPNDPLPGQRNPPPAPVIGTDQPEWEVARILGSRHYRRVLQYRVKWINEETEDHNWYPWWNFKNAVRKILGFHADFPTAARPRVLPELPSEDD